jgi:hypothetical protein
MENTIKAHWKKACVTILIQYKVYSKVIRSYGNKLRPFSIIRVSIH